MLEIPIIIRKVPESANIDIPKNALRDFFRVANINLSFFDGQDFEKDLPDDIPSKSDFVNKLQKESAPKDSIRPHPAILILGNLSTYGGGTNGELLDTEKRGLVAVYSGSQNFRIGSIDDRFEIFAHEIGHLLNLIHIEENDRKDDYTSVMRQRDERAIVSNVRDKIWKSAIEQASPSDKARISDFFQSGHRSPLGLPLSLSSMDYLKKSSIRIQPWGDSFRDAGDGGNLDQNDSGLLMHVKLENQDFSVGEPLDFQIVIKVARNAEGGVIVPKGIGTNFGTLTLKIKNPDGDERYYRSRSVVCDSSTTLLRAGESFNRNFSKLLDREGLIFAKPGKYILSFFCPSLNLKTVPLAIDVKPACHKIIEKASFQTFLTAGLPQSFSRQWTQLDTLIQDPLITESMRSNLIELRISRRPHSRKNSDLFRFVRENKAPRRVMERLFTSECARMAHSSQSSAFDRLVNEAKEYFSETDKNHPSIEFLDSLKNPSLGAKSE